MSLTKKASQASSMRIAPRKRGKILSVSDENSNFSKPKGKVHVALPVRTEQTAEMGDSHSAKKRPFNEYTNMEKPDSTKQKYDSKRPRTLEQAPALASKESGMKVTVTKASRPRRESISESKGKANKQTPTGRPRESRPRKSPHKLLVRLKSKNKLVDSNNLNQTENIKEQGARRKTTVSKIPVLKPARAPPVVASQIAKTTASSSRLDELEKGVGNLIVTLPKGVEDVDTDYDDTYGANVYIADIMAYMKARENKWAIPQSYVTNCPIKSHTRAILVDWIIQVQCHLRLSQPTLHLSVTLIDQFLNRCILSVGKIQLLGITCVFLAGKFEDRFPPTIAELLHLTDDSYKMGDVIRMELLICKTLQFDINVPTPTVFLDRALHIAHADKNEVYFMSRYILDLVLPHLKFLDHTVSNKAASAVYLSKAILANKENILADCGRQHLETCLTSLAYYLHLTEEDILVCARRLARQLLKAESDKFQAARTKHARSHYLAVSNHPCLKGETLKEFASIV